MRTSLGSGLVVLVTLTGCTYAPRESLRGVEAAIVTTPPESPHRHPRQTHAPRTQALLDAEAAGLVPGDSAGGPSSFIGESQVAGDAPTSSCIPGLACAPIMCTDAVTEGCVQTTLISSAPLAPPPVDDDVSYVPNAPAPDPNSVILSADYSEQAPNNSGNDIDVLCSNEGTSQNGTNMLQAQGLYLVNTQTGENVGEITGREYQALVNDTRATGTVRVNITGQMPPTSTEYALMDTRFYPCAKSIQRNHGDTDPEDFPKGCGIVGYMMAAASSDDNGYVTNVNASPSSELLLSNNPGDDVTGCQNYNSPLVIDLGGAGIEMSPPASGMFDVTGDGRPDTISWTVSNRTPFVVLDRNGNGAIDGIDEMFGTQTAAPDGTRPGYASGFEALGAYDDPAQGGNGDGRIDASDRIFASLRLWFDRNHDGRTDAGELETLEQRGIVVINLHYVDAVHPLSFDNQVRQRSAAMMRDGSEAPVLDLWFNVHGR